MLPPPKFLATLSIVLFLVQQCLNSPVYTMQPAFITANIGTSGRNIRHLPCVSRRSGQSGVCMFAIDCLKSNGTHLGTCIDRFYFGSCCHIEPGHDINDNVISDSALPHDRHPPYRLSSTTTSTNFSTSISSTTEKMISSSTSGFTLENRSTSKIPDIVTEQTVATKKPLTSTTTTQAPQISTTEVANVSTTILKVSSAATTKAAAASSATTESYKITTFQSVAEKTTSSTTTTTKNKTTKPIKTTTYKPTTTTKAQTKPRPRPTTKPISSTKPGLTRPTTRPTTRIPTKPTRPTAKPTLRPTARPTARPSTRPPTKSPIKVTAKPLSKPSTKPSSSTTKQPSRPVTTTSVRPTTTKPIKTTIRPTTQKITTTPKPTTTSTTTTTTTSTTTTTTTTTEAPKTPEIEISTPPISNDILSSTKLPSSETVNGNTATNEIEPIAKPTPEKKPDLAITTDRTTTTTTTTQMPAFITWAMVNNEQTTTKEPMNNTEAPDEWSPITPPDGWVLLPSVVTTTPEPETMPTSPSTTSTTLPPTFSTFSSFSSYETTSTTQSPTLTTSSLTSESISLPSSISTSSPSPPPTLTELLSSSTAALQTDKVPGVSGVSGISGISEMPEDESTSGVTEKMNVTSSSVTMELVPLVNISSTTEGMEQSTSSMTTPIQILESTPPPVNMSDFTDVCGRRMFPEARIVGGEKSSFGKWPWQISLRQWKTSTYLHKCGAALLNENWAITAAHCVDNVPPSDLLLRLGEHDLSTDAEPYIHQERRVQIVASHPQFDPRTFEYDLALLRFYEPVQFQPNIIPVCVPQNDETFVGRSAFVTGWGRLYEDGPLPSILQEVSVPVINNTVCEAMYRNAGYIEHIPNIFICAGWKHGGYDSCEGDSGGPMVIQRPDKRFLLAGIISWGIGCAEPNQPGVYTRISEFRDWINQILQF